MRRQKTERETTRERSEAIKTISSDLFSQLIHSISDSCRSTRHKTNKQTNKLKRRVKQMYVSTLRESERPLEPSHLSGVDRFWHWANSEHTSKRPLRVNAEQTNKCNYTEITKEMSREN